MFPAPCLRRPRIFFPLGLLLLACATWLRAGPAADEAGGWPALTRENRPWTFNWWLGSAVDQENLGRELDRYRDAGLGGIHVIPIYGAKGAEARWRTFLSPEWLAMFDWTVDEAGRRGLGVDLTTGTGWCFGGPDVSPAEAATRLVLIDADFPADGKIKLPARAGEIRWQSFEAISAGGARQDLRAAVDAEGRLGWTPPGGVAGWSVVAVGVQPTRQKVKRAGPGGDGFMINPFDAEAMDDYLKPFRVAFAADSGHRRPRAMYHDSFEYYEAAWSADLAAEFFRRRGYHLEENWPLLAGHGDPEKVARLWHDYRQTVSDLMIEKSFPVWHGWAAQNGMLTRNQAHGSPANLLDLYALASIPETEMFGHGGPDPLDSRFDENIGKADRSVQVSKFASSAANVAGRRLVSAETGTWMAEHFHESYEELKTFMDRLFVAGINHVFYHGNAYSPDDVAWPGWLFYAASQLNTRNPLWREFAAVNAYVARVQSVLQAAAPDNDFLLYWPVDDVWSNPKPGVGLLSVHDRGWVPAAGERLFDQGYAFDYGSDRQIVALRAGDGGTVAAPGATYRTVVFPASKTLPLETLRAALRLAEAGATICLVAPVAADVPGLRDVEERRSELRTLLPDLAGVELTEAREIHRGRGRLLIGSAEKILAAAGIEPEPAVRAAPGLLLLRKAEPGGHCYFLANQALRPLDGWVELGRPATGVTVMNPLSGEIAAGRVRQSAAGRPELRLYLEPGHSVLLRTRSGPAADGTDPKVPSPARPGETLFTLEGRWRVEFVTGGPELPAPWTPERLVSWAGSGDEKRDAFSGTARYVTRFDCASARDRGLFLELGEVREVARVRLNGSDLGVTFMRPHRLAVPAGLLRERGNELEIEVTNLGANRLRDLDRHGVPWRNYFFVTIRYKDFDAAQWPLAPSGLLGPVTFRARLQE